MDGRQPHFGHESTLLFELQTNIHLMFISIPLTEHVLLEMQSHTSKHAKDIRNKLRHLDILFIIAGPVGGAHWPAVRYF